MILLYQAFCRYYFLPSASQRPIRPIGWRSGKLMVVSRLFGVNVVASKHRAWIVVASAANDTSTGTASICAKADSLARAGSSPHIKGGREVRRGGEGERTTDEESWHVPARAPWLAGEDSLCALAVTGRQAARHAAAVCCCCLLAARRAPCSWPGIDGDPAFGVISARAR